MLTSLGAPESIKCEAEVELVMMTSKLLAGAGGTGALQAGVAMKDISHYSLLKSAASILLFAATIQVAMSANPFSVTQRTAAHGPEVVLRDSSANTTAVVLPQAGFNCLRFTLAPKDGAPIEFLAGPADPAALSKGGSGFGWPILFPFPNRVAKGEFTFGGKTYRLPPRPGMAHAIHGFVHVQPWRVTSTAADAENGASVTAVTDTDSNQGLKEHWPWPCRLTVTYQMKGLSLAMVAVAENLGKEPMPFGFGVHPYHPLPLTPAGSRARCEVQVPCQEKLELTPDCIPTGKRVPAEWTQMRAIGDLKLDDVLTATQLDAIGSACVLRDPDSKWNVTMHADAGFKHWVVYAPQRSVICFEPYTCLTDAFNMHARGMTDTGFAVLEPGKPWRGVVTMRVEQR